MKSMNSLSLRSTKFIFILLALFSLTPYVSPAVSLLLGLLLAAIIGNPYLAFSKKVSKKLLQYAVVGLGFGMNLHQALASGKQGMMFTIVSVTSIILLSILFGKLFKLNHKTSFLIGAGTAICGGSAIAAIGPVIKAKDDEMTLSLATIFILNAIALFIFPFIGHQLGMSQTAFGTWCAMSIHDTSSVVGAGAAYGETALQVATMVKLTRALWIIPVCLITSLFYRKDGGAITYPWFILFFILVLLINTFLPIPQAFSNLMVMLSKRALNITLFLIGSGITIASIRQVGFRSMLIGILLWFIVSLVSLFVII